MTVEELIYSLIPIFRDPLFKEEVLFHFTPYHGTSEFSFSITLNKKILLVYTKLDMQVISTDDLYQQFMIAQNIKEIDLYASFEKVKEILSILDKDSHVCNDSIKYYKVNLKDGVANIKPLSLAEYFNVLERL